MTVPRFALCLLAGFAGCLTVAADPAAGLPAANQSKTLIVRLRRGTMNRLGFDATIEGVRGNIMVDTGASFSVLNEARFGFLLRGPERQLPAGVAATSRVNDMKARVASARDFHLGSVDLGAARFSLVPEDELYENLHTSYRGRYGNYDGMMGEDFLRRYQGIVDCSRQLLYLSLNSGKIPSLAPVLCSHGWVRVPMDNVGNDLAVACELRGHALRLIVDTGAVSTTMDQAWLDGAHVSSDELPMRAAVIGNNAHPLSVARVDRLRIGDFTAPNVEIASTPDLRRVFGKIDAGGSSGPVVGLLGSDTLALNGAIVDVGDHALYLKAASAGGR